jgi:hypothetical protein
VVRFLDVDIVELCQSEMKDSEFRGRNFFKEGRL